MEKDKQYYLIENNSIKPVKVIEELHSGMVNVKNINNNITRWVSKYTIWDTEKEAYKRLLQDLNYDKEEAEDTIEDLKEVLIVINQTIENLKQKYEKKKFKEMDKES